MNERFTNYEQFEMHMRGKKFAEAAKILVEYCVGLSVDAVTEILKVASVAGGALHISKLGGPRRRRVQNAFQHLRTPAESVTTKEQRAIKNGSLQKRY